MKLIELYNNFLDLDDLAYRVEMSGSEAVVRHVLVISESWGTGQQQYVQIPVARLTPFPPIPDQVDEGVLLEFEFHTDQLLVVFGNQA